MHQFTSLLTHLLTYALNHPLTYLLTYFLPSLLTYSRTYLPNKPISRFLDVLVLQSFLHLRSDRERSTGVEVGVEATTESQRRGEELA